MREYRKVHPEVEQMYREGIAFKTDTLADSSGMWVIPVVVHIAFVTDTFQVPDSQVYAQIEALNETYGRTGLGANTDSLSKESGLRFCLATIDPNGNPTNGIDRFQYTNANNYIYPKDEEDLKKNSSWDPDHYLNLWLTGIISMEGVNGTLEGYAYYPPGVAGTWTDGIVITRKRFGLGGVADTSSYGKTFTHEIGHYLNLYHTWGDENDCSGTDYIEDTPPCSAQYFDCSPTVQCNDEFRQIHNYMDYTPDFCQNMFTRQQILRMRSAILQYRPQLISRENLLRTGCGSWLENYPVIEEFKIYPNPTWTGTFYVYLGYSDSASVQIEVFDMLGQKVFETASEGPAVGPLAVDMRGWRGGQYFFRVTKGESTWYRRAMIAY